jgi:hypothetical protein
MFAHFWGELRRTGPGMTTIVISILLVCLTATALACLMWLERKQPLRVRLQPILAILISLLILWVLTKYGDAVLHWIRH